MVTYSAAWRLAKQAQSLPRLIGSYARKLVRLNIGQMKTAEGMVEFSAPQMRDAQAVRVDEPTFEALFNADIAKSLLEHFWANVRARLPLTSKSDRLRPKDLLAALAYSGKGTIRSVSYCSSSVCGSRKLGRYPRCQRRLKSPLQPALLAAV